MIVAFPSEVGKSTCLVKLAHTGQHDLDVDDEERHAVHAMSPSHFLRFRDRGQTLVAVQHDLGSVPVQASVRSHVSGDCVISVAACTPDATSGTIPMRT